MTFSVNSQDDLPFGFCNVFIIFSGSVLNKWAKAQSHKSMELTATTSQSMTQPLGPETSFESRQSRKKSFIETADQEFLLILLWNLL